MILSGISDEAGPSLDTQIKAHKELGWEHISIRNIEGTNIHDLSEKDFDVAAGKLEDAGMQVIEFASLIGNWAKSVEVEFDVTIGEINRAIPRMNRLGCKMVRVMSYAQEPWGENQHAEERFRRLRAIIRRFDEAGITAIHENCMNYGGFSTMHTLRLLKEVPNLKLVFDTGNPVFQLDRSKPEPFPWQDPMEFYEAVKGHIAHVHVKDCLNPKEGETEPEKYTMPGEGQAQIPQILEALKRDNYQGAIAIEPHVATVFHVKDGQEVDEQQCYDSYVEYGKRFEKMVREAGFEVE